MPGADDIDNMVAAALAGNVAARRALEEAGLHLGRGLASIVNLINPSVVVIGGDLGMAGDLLLEPTRVALRRYAVDPVAWTPVLPASSRPGRAWSVPCCSPPSARTSSAEISRCRTGPRPLAGVLLYTGLRTTSGTVAVAGSGRAARTPDDARGAARVALNRRRGAKQPCRGQQDPRQQWAAGEHRRDVERARRGTEVDDAPPAVAAFEAEHQVRRLQPGEDSGAAASRRRGPAPSDRGAASTRGR